MIKTNKMFEVSKLYRYFYEMVGSNFEICMESDNVNDVVYIWLKITIKGDSIIHEIQTELPYKFKFSENEVFVII